MAISSATQELLWLKQLLKDLHIFVDTPTMFTDNMGAKQLAYNPTHHRRTKHIDVRVHFVRDHIAAGNLTILHVPTDENPSDLMTKAVKRSTFQYLSPKLRGQINTDRIPTIQTRQKKPSFIKKKKMVIVPDHLRTSSEGKH
jgi:hypothetical protein